MIQARMPIESDLVHLAECYALDEWHKGDAPLENWLNSELTTFFDAKGPILHMAFRQEGKTARLHAQFDPREKFRTAHGIIEALRRIKQLAPKIGADRLVFYTRSPKLASFMVCLGFKKDGADYVLPLEKEQCH